MASVPLTVPPSRTPSDLDGLIGARLRLLRKTRGLSQTSLADLLGITFQQVQKYEGGRNRISAVTLFLIADNLAVPVTYFYEDFGIDEAGAGMVTLNNPYQAFAASAEGQKLIDSYRACPPPVRRSTLSLLKAASERARDGKPDDVSADTTP